MRTRPALPLLLVLATSVAATAQRQRVVRISPSDASSPAEVSVGIDPTDPDRIVAVSLQPRSPTTNFAYVSSDFGATWFSLPGANPESRTQGDDAIAFDADGRAFWSYISFTGLRQERPRHASNGIFVKRSDDAGRSFGPPVTVVDHENTVSPFEDKPFLAAGPDGRVIVAWTRFSSYGSADPADTSHIYVSVSEDAGASFSAPTRVSDAPGDAIDSDGTLEGVVPSFGVDGAVYLVWSGPRGLELDVSRDGGWSFGADRVISAHPGGWDVDVDGIGRANGMPVTAVDHSAGPLRGAFYVNWVDERLGELDVWILRSDDGGGSWGEPVRVNADPAGTGAAQFFTWMAVDPVDGSVNVAFYDRAGLDGTRTGVTLARSVDGGVHFETHRVAIEAFETTENVFFGDYLGVDAYGGRVVAAFSHFIGSAELALSAALFQFP